MLFILSIGSVNDDNDEDEDDYESNNNKNTKLSIWIASKKPKNKK